MKSDIKNINNETEDVIKILEELNFYNKKEQRSDWWSHFSNLQKDTEDLIEDTNYNIDIVDLYTALHCAMEDFEMYQ